MAIGTLEVDGTQARLGCVRPSGQGVTMTLSLELARALATERERSRSRRRNVHPSSGTLLGRHLPRAPIDARSCLLASPSPSAGRLSSHPCAPVRYRACEAGAEGRAEDEGTV